jgi:methionyl-tRNA synthetase
MKDTYTTDGLRYFLLRDGIPSTDNNISTDKILNILNAELCNITGNLFTRCNSESINQTQIYPSYEKVKHCFTKFDMDFLDDLNRLRNLCDLSNEKFNFYESIQNIMSMMRRTNIFIDEYKPWILAKDERNRMKVNVVLFIAFEVLRIGGILLQPITPNMSANLLDALNVDENARGFDNATVNTNKAESTILPRKFVFFRRIKPNPT